MTHQIRIIIFLSCLLLVKGVVSQDSLRVVGQVFDGDNGMPGVTITVRDTSSTVAVYKTNPQGKFDFQLGYEDQFTMKFSRKNHMPKTVSVDTRIPRDLDPVLQQLVLIRLELLENLSGYNTSDDPLGRIYFSRITEEFTYETRYSGNLTTNFEVSGTDFRLSHFTTEEDATIEEDENEDIKIRVEENETQTGEEPAIIKPEPDPEWKLRFYRTIVHKRNQFLGEDPDSVNLHKDLPSLRNLGKRLSFDTAISHYARQGMKVTEVIINQKKHLKVYHRVRHHWGAVFYFRNYRSVSKLIYEQGTTLADKHEMMNP